MEILKENIAAALQPERQEKNVKKPKYRYHRFPLRRQKNRIIKRNKKMKFPDGGGCGNVGGGTKCHLILRIRLEAVSQSMWTTQHYALLSHCIVRSPVFRSHIFQQMLFQKPMIQWALLAVKSSAWKCPLKQRQYQARVIWGLSFHKGNESICVTLPNVCV